MIEKLVGVKYYIISFAGGCLFTTASFLLIPAKEVTHAVKTEEHTQLQVDKKIEIASKSDVEVHSVRGTITTKQKVTKTHLDGTSTVSEQSTVEEPVVVDTHATAAVESHESSHLTAVSEKKTEEITTTTSKLSRYSLGCIAPPFEIAKGDFSGSRVEAGVRLGNLPVWGVVSSDLKLKVNVGLRLEL